MRTFNGFMHGINLGGWLSQYDENTKEYFDTFITKEDIDRIASMGLDHVRLPISYDRLEEEDGTVKEEGYQYIDNAVAWCREAGLHIILDLHNAYGYSFDPLQEIEDRELFFRSEPLWQRFVSLWERIAARYSAYPDDVAYELLNEIISPAIAEEWNNIADAAIAAIRRVAPRSWIIVGGVRYNHVTSVPMLHKPADDRIVYNFHCYEPIVFTHQKAFWMSDTIPQDREVLYPDSMKHYEQMTREMGEDPSAEGGLAAMGASENGVDFFTRLFVPAVEAARKNDAPLYCGEYGVIDQAPAESSLHWLEDISRVFETYGIGRALWTYKKKDFGLIGPHYDPIRERMIRLL